MLRLQRASCCLPMASLLPPPLPESQSSLGQSIVRDATIQLTIPICQCGTTCEQMLLSLAKNAAENQGLEQGGQLSFLSR